MVWRGNDDFSTLVFFVLVGAHNLPVCASLCSGPFGRHVQSFSELVVLASFDHVLMMPVYLPFAS